MRISIDTGVGNKIPSFHLHQQFKATFSTFLMILFFLGGKLQNMLGQESISSVLFVHGFLKLFNSIGSRSSNVVSLLKHWNLIY